MQLTPTQATAFAADVANDPVLSQLTPSADNAFAIAAAYQAIAAPDYIVWKSSVTRDEIMQNGFDWTRLDNLSVGKARVWDAMFDNETRTTNPSKINVRAGIEEVWKGTAPDLAVREAAYGHCRRKANRLEKLFAVGAGTTVAPSTMAIEGSLTYTEAQLALGW